jgi:hypothetical protein
MRTGINGGHDEDVLFRKLYQYRAEYGVGPHVVARRDGKTTPAALCHAIPKNKRWEMSDLPEDKWNRLAKFGRKKVNNGIHGWFKTETLRTVGEERYAADTTFNHVITMLATAYRRKWRKV